MASINLIPLDGGDSDNATEQPRYQAPSSLSYGAFEEEIRNKWNRSSDAFPLAADIPRLVKLIEVNVEGKKIWPEINKSFKNKAEHIFSLLQCLCSLLEDEECNNLLTGQFWSYFDDDPTLELIDVSKRLEKVMKELLGSDCKVIRLLKACNQSILAPPVVRLKYYIGNEFPYHDATGTWKIHISFWGDHVRAKHIRWEKSIEKDSFSFKWEFELVFNKMLRDFLSLDLYISELKFGQKEEEEITRKSKLKVQCHQACWSLTAPKSIFEHTL